MESFVANDKFQYFLRLAKGLGIDEDTSTRNFQGLLKNGIHWKGKQVDWIKVVVVIDLSAQRQDLPFLMQVFQFFMFPVANHFLSVSIVHIFVDVGWERLQWLH